MTVSRKLAALPASPTLAVNTRAKQLKAEGRDVLSFAAGEPDFATPDHVLAAAAAAASTGQTRYTPVPGTPALRQAVCDYQRRVGGAGVDYELGDVLVSCGAKHALYNLFQALLDPGDAVLIPAPYWVSYPAQVQLAGATSVPVHAHLSDGFVPTRGALREAVGLARNAGARPKAVIINSPCNPTGAGYPRAALEALVEESLSLGLSIVSDEIYGRLTYDGFEHTSIPSLSAEAKAATYLVDGVSKTFAMTGWRTGWVVADASNRDVLVAATNLQSQSTSGPSSISQAAALAAITSPEPFLADWIAAYAARRTAMVDGLNAIDGVTCPSPQGAFYVFPNVSAVMTARGMKSDTELALHLLEEAGVACVPGTPFGAPGHLRLSYATSLDTVHEGLRRLTGALAG